MPARLQSLVPPPDPGNAPEWTVSELSAAIKRSLESEFGIVRLRGEISNYRGPAASGHAYFCIKDGGARLDAVMWKGSLARLRVRPEEGLEVVATGRITTFPGRSAYQIVVETLEPAGLGALMAMLEARRRALAEEGLFAPERKRKLPFLPRLIGVVTSPTGAVIRDILHRLADRFPTDVLVWPVRVQGEGSAEEVARAIEGLNALEPVGPVPRPDVIIVARGGGSIEDLWSFNEEVVVRAAAASLVPLVSAVGHETDTTLIDLAADRRAPTPTGAAEIVVPVRDELVAGVATLGFRLAGATRRGLEGARGELRSVLRALPPPEAVTGPRRQRLDLAVSRLDPALLAALRGAEGRFGGLARRFAARPPELQLSRARQRLAGIDDRPRHALERLIAIRRVLVTQQGERLEAARDAALQQARLRVARHRDRADALGLRLDQAFRGAAARRAARLAGLGQLLGTLSYRAVLARGYALILDEAGRPVRAAAETHDGQRVALTFADGRAAATIGEEPRPARASRRPAADPARRGPLQGSLFEA